MKLKKKENIKSERKNKDKKAEKLVNNKKTLTHENSQIRDEIRELNKKINAYDNLTDSLSRMLKSKP